MSLLSQLDAFIADGTVAKAGKPKKKGKTKSKNPNAAGKYVRPGLPRIPGERHGFVPMPTPVIYEDNKTIVEGKFVPTRPVSYFEEHGQKSAMILSDDDISAFRDMYRAMEKGDMDAEEASHLIRFILRNALHVDGKDLAILRTKKDEE